MTVQRARRTRRTRRSRAGIGSGEISAAVQKTQVVWCDFGEHTYKRAPIDDWPPFACPNCTPNLPTPQEAEAQAGREKARVKRLLATASSYAGPTADLTCAGCETWIAFPRDQVPLCRLCRNVGVADRSGWDGEIEPGAPFAAAREIGLTITAADVEWLERRAARSREAVDETLWCEGGGHEWVLPRIPGRRPRSCPLHSEADHSQPRDGWPGALPDCFLIEGCWAVRLFVDAPLLRGATWRVPPAIAERLGIEAERSLRPEQGSLSQSLVLRPRGNGYAAGNLTAALQAVGVMEGDFVFVRLSPSSYDVIGRRRREIVSTDALGRLLWGCGTDPNDADARAQPWLVLARAIGGAEPAREALRQRLAARRNYELVTALDETRGVRAATKTVGSEWPPGWEFVASLDEDDSRFALHNGIGAVRVAVGVTDARTDAEGLLIDSTGVAWRELDAAQDESLDGGTKPPNERWIRWKRAEHHAVRAALAGAVWRLTQLDGMWRLSGDDAYLDLADALAAVPTTPDGRPHPPHTGAHSTSPRSGFAYDRIVRRALDSGLCEIEADAAAGLAATFENGDRIEGPTLSDLLARTA